MNRRQLAFVVLLNAVISLVIALLVVWIVEARRPDPEALAALYTPSPALDVPIAPTLSPTPQPGSAGASAAGGDAQAAAPTAAPAGGEASTGDTGATGETTETTEYVVQVGDSLSGIADRFGVPVSAIVEANKLANPDVVFSGQRLNIPAPGATGTGGAAATPTPIAAAVTTGINIGGVAGVGDVAAEVVDIANDSDLAVNLQGWRLEREGGPAYTFGSLLLFPGSGVKVHSGAGADSSVDVFWNQPAAVWASGAAARLVNPQGVEVARYNVP